MTVFDIRMMVSNTGMRSRVSKLSLVWAIVFLAYVNPAYLDRFSGFGFFTLAIKLLVFGYFLFRAIMSLKFPMKLLPWLGYAIVPTVMTILNHGDIKGALVYSFTIVSMALIFFYMKKAHVKDAVGGLALIMEILIFINLATIVLVPNGLYSYETEAGWYSSDVWFFGLRNSHPPFLVFACFASVMDYYINGGTIRKNLIFLTHIITISTIALLHSGGGFVAFSLYFLLLFLLNRKNIDKLKPFVLKIGTVVAINVTIFTFLSFFAAITNVAEYFRIIGEQRVYTLGRRISIWAAVWEHVVDAPLLGSGFMKIEDLDWLTNLAAGATTSHNSMIDICFRGGFITLLIYCVMLIVTGISVSRNTRIDYRIKNYISVSWFAVLLLLQSEGAMMCIPLLVTVGLTYCYGEVGR